MRRMVHAGALAAWACCAAWLLPGCEPSQTARAQTPPRPPAGSGQRPATAPSIAEAPKAAAVAPAREATPAVAAETSTPSPTIRQMAAALRAAHAKAGSHLWFEVRLSSPALATNMEGSDGTVTVGVHLPGQATACVTQAGRCWLAAYLPGFDGNPAQSYAAMGSNIAGVVDGLVKSGEIAPLVVVVPDPRTRLGGSFYVDSAASGLWQTFVMDEMLPAARLAFVPSAGRSHTIALGHSMGGFGAMWLGLARPDALRGVAGISPVASSALAEEVLLPIVEAARKGNNLQPDQYFDHPTTDHFFERLLLAMAQAFAPATQSTHGLKLPFDPQPHPWRFRAEVSAQFSRFDLVRVALEHGGASARKLERVFLASGSKDRIIAVRYAEALAKSLRTACLPIADLRVALHDGSHGSRLRTDAADALRFLMSDRPPADARTTCAPSAP